MQRPAQAVTLNFRGTPRNAAHGVVMGKDGQASARRTATLTKAQVAELDRLSEKTGLSVSWLLRQGAEMLIEKANSGPLIPGLVEHSNDR